TTVDRQVSRFTGGRDCYSAKLGWFPIQDSHPDVRRHSLLRRARLLFRQSGILVPVERLELPCPKTSRPKRDAAAISPHRHIWSRCQVLILGFFLIREVG